MVGGVRGVVEKMVRTNNSCWINSHSLLGCSQEARSRPSTISVTIGLGGTVPVNSPLLSVVRVNALTIPNLACHFHSCQGKQLLLE